MIHINPQINPYIALVLLLAALALAFHSYLSRRRLLRKPHLIFLISLRTVALVMLFLILLRPFYEETEPDTSLFSITFLADASGSMLTEDCNGKKRIDVASDIVKTNPADFFRVNNSTIKNHETYIFSETPIRYFGGGFSPLPGKTALGDTLLLAADKSPSTTQGAIVLISDGNSNLGADPVETAKGLRSLGIPITCIGTGDLTPVEDLEVTVPEKAISAKKGEPVEIVSTVKNTSGKTARVDFELYRGGSKVGTNTISVPPNSSADCKTRTIPLEPGRNVYKIKIISQDVKDRKPENNIAFASVMVSEPDTFKILYLGAILDWNFKFLKLHCDESKQFIFDAVVKNGEKDFFITDGIAAKMEKGEKAFPKDSKILFGYDAIAVDLRTIKYLPENYLEALSGFTGDRGGGIVFLGTTPGDSGSEILQALLPMKKTVTKKASGKEFLKIDAPYVFGEGDCAVLYEEPGIPIPPGLDYFYASELKTASKNALHDRAGNSLLCLQNYGGGRTAYFGLDSSWRWHLEDNVQMEKYKSFWNSLIVWMASGTKKRIRLDSDGRKFTVSEESTLKAEILDRNYLPASDAEVSAVITRPDGSAEEIPFVLSGNKDGEFSANFAPYTPGEYEISVTAKFNDGEKISGTGSFLGLYGGVESVQNEFREDVLRDLARLSGGTYIGWKDLPDKMDIPVSHRVDKKTVRIDLAENIFFPLLLFMLLATEWYFRRRIGLK